MNNLATISTFFKKYIPMFFLICFSGNPLVISMSYSKPLLIGFTTFFFLYTLYIIDLQMLKKALGILGILFISIFTIIFLQKIILNFVSFPGIMGYLIKIIFSLTILIYYESVKTDFIDTYIKTLVFLSIISLPFWLLNQFGFYGIDVHNFTKSLFFYTSFPHSPYFAIRNSGMFWEPGAFAGYLILTLIFITLKNRRFQIGPYRKEVFWILTALLTTMSTAGFIVFGIILMFYSLQNYQWGKIVVIPFFIFIMGIAYTNLDFLKEKIDRQYTEALAMDERDVSANRFGALKMDLQYIRSQPLIGNGLHSKTRFRFHSQIQGDIGHGNGMSNFIATWGIPFFLLWLYFVYKFSKQVSHSPLTSALALIIIVLLLQGEQYLNLPLFLSFFFMPFVYENKISTKNKIHLIKLYLEK